MQITLLWTLLFAVAAVLSLANPLPFNQRRESLDFSDEVSVTLFPRERITSTDATPTGSLNGTAQAMAEATTPSLVSTSSGFQTLGKGSSGTALLSTTIILAIACGLS